MINPHVHIPYDKVGNYFSFIRDNQLNLEIYFSADTLDRFGNASVEQTIAELDYDPSLSIHAPFMDLSPGAVDRGVREVTLARFNRIMDIATIIRPKTVVFHSGYEKWKYALNMDVWLEKSMFTWKEMLKHAEEIKTTIAIENIFEDTPDNLRLLAEEMDSESFGLCFDSGHFNLFSKVSLDEWIGQTGQYIKELHLHDNDGSKDAHCSIGKGTFAFHQLFPLLNDKKDIIYTIEAHSPSDALQSLSTLSKY